MSRIPYTFDAEGMRRAVAAIKKVEANDTLSTTPRRRRRPGGAGPEAFVIARVTEIDAANPMLVSAKEQYWSDADEEMVELPAGRTWDGADGNPAKVRLLPGESLRIDDIVLLGFKHGGDGTGQWYALPSHRRWFHAKVTASSSSSADHTITEVDANGDALTGGRVITDAKAMNERKGVPVDTYVIVFDLGPTTAGGAPVYKFIITDGLTDNPKDLIATTVTANTTAYDIEVDSEPVEYLACRIKDDTANSGLWYFYNREVIADASGMITNVSAETRVEMPGNGYYETRHNNVLVDQIPSNGVLDFDDSPTTGTDELPVEFILTAAQDADAVAAGNDGLRTVIQGKVDVSSVTGGGGGGSSTVVKKLIKITDAASTGLFTIDASDFSGTSAWGFINPQYNKSDTQYNESSSDFSSGFTVNYLAGSSSTVDSVLLSGSVLDIFLDASDGHKLKLDLKIAPATAGNSHFINLMLMFFDAKTATTPDLTFNT